MRISDWSSDVCSSDLVVRGRGAYREPATEAAPAGREVPLVPKQQASLWTRYDLTPRLGAGVGVYHQSRSFTSISNTAILPAFTRIDAAAFFKLTPQLAAQITVETLLKSNYFSSASTANTIMPGAPLTVR